MAELIDWRQLLWTTGAILGGEKLIAFLQQKYPDCLPKVRTDIQRVPEALARC